MEFKKFFKGKHITLMRIGLLGRGVQDAATLAECGAKILVTDDAPQEVMQPSVDALKQYSNITFKFGPYEISDFTHCDMVLKGAGAALDSPEIKEAKRLGVPVRMSADLFAEFSGIPIIGVTGTRGKSTVTEMIFEIVKQAGMHALLGGNVRGVSNLALLKEVQKDTVAVLELDSWQLQGFGEIERSPQIAVFTTFFDDHLNYYKNDRERYLADKANIFLFQDEGDTLVMGVQTQEALKKYRAKMRAQVVVAGEKEFPKEWTLALPGIHNRYNAALALSAARALAIPDEVSRIALGSFKALSGRLEFLREVRGIKIYNDNNATTPDATIAALRAFPEAAGRIVLIMGGSDKGLSMDTLLEEMKKTCKAVVLLKGTGTGKLQMGHLNLKTTTVDMLPEAFEKAFSWSEKGDIILFSPAFASFGMFKNEYERNDRFTTLVHGYEA